MVNEIVGFRQLVESVAKLERGVKILEACQAEFNKGVDRRFEVLEREAKARRDGQTLQAQAQASHDKRLTRRVNKIEREVQTLDPGWAGTGADADVYSTSVTEHASLGDEPRIHDASAKPVSDDEAAIRRHFHEQRMGVTPQTSVPKEFADALAFDQAVMDTGPAHIKIEQKGPAYAKVHFGSAEAKVPYSAITLGVDDKAGYWYKIRIDIDVRGFLRATYEAAE
jgi:hypothetical protein